MYSNTEQYDVGDFFGSICYQSQVIHESFENNITKTIKCFNCECQSESFEPLLFIPLLLPKGTKSIVSIEDLILSTYNTWVNCPSDTRCDDGCNVSGQKKEKTQITNYGKTIFLQAIAVVNNQTGERNDIYITKDVLKKQVTLNNMKYEINTVIF